MSENDQVRFPAAGQFADTLRGIALLRIGPDRNTPLFGPLRQRLQPCTNMGQPVIPLPIVGPLRVDHLEFRNGRNPVFGFRQRFLPDAAKKHHLGPQFGGYVERLIKQNGPLVMHVKTN